MQSHRPLREILGLSEAHLDIEGEPVSLYPTEGHAPGGHDNYEDLSYDDALLDTEARLFFRAELGPPASPDPARSFSLLVDRIAQTEAELSDAARQPVRPPARPPVSRSLLGALAGSRSSRVLSGAVAVLILAAVLGSDAAHLMRTGSSPSSPVVNDGEGPYATVTSTGQARTQPTSAPAVSYPTYYSDSAESTQLHPVELGMEPASHRGNTPRDNNGWYPPRRSFGPE